MRLKGVSVECKSDYAPHISFTPFQGETVTRGSYSHNVYWSTLNLITLR